MREDLMRLIINSWANEEEGIDSTFDLLEWIKQLNANTYVNVEECSINDSNFWFYDDYNGEILNRKRSFFSVKGIRYFVDKQFVSEQPIIMQQEIGYLGIICKVMNNVLYFLMQAKIEPGNTNCIQISPTIQATKSNFTRAHGGKMPLYIEYFEKAHEYQVIYDQIQSEQGERFFKKRNRNMIILVDEPIEVNSYYRWMTLGQIKKLMEIYNLVNMDTRTVLSGLPFYSVCSSDKTKQELQIYFKDQALYNSIFKADPIYNVPNILHKMNNFKMFHDIELVSIPLNQLVEWEVTEYGVTCRKQADFMVRYYDIEIENREVRKWSQPLFKAIGSATFGLITKKNNGVRYFLIKIKPELGSFDKVELGPSVQWKASHYLYDDNKVEALFRKKLERKSGIICDVILSEEGGRFYHEQNRNIILEIKEEELSNLSEEYVWATLSDLSILMQSNNCLNIQLRNLISLIKL